MDCTKCDRGAVLHAAYSGAHLCERHLRASVEKRVRRRVRKDGLIGDDATPENPETWVIGLSGGKDSVVLASILADTFSEDPRIELVALTIHEGIAGYRDESEEAASELAADLDLRHERVSYAEEFDLRMDDVAEQDPENMAPCAYCGVFRRDLLERHADDLGADKLLTGHNLDDEAQTALMNFLEGDVAAMAQGFDASLGAFEERSPTDAFVPRAKPLRDVPEKEVALYAHLADLPVHMAECPHAEEAYRGEIQELLHDLEDRHPGTRHSIMAGYEELAGTLAADRRGDPDGQEERDRDTDDQTSDDRADDDPELGECERCGAATARDVCRKCQLVESVHAA